MVKTCEDFPELESIYVDEDRESFYGSAKAEISGAIQNAVLLTRGRLDEIGALSLYTSSGN